MDFDLRAAADVFVIGALVGILEASPAADIVDQDRAEIRWAILYIVDQLLQRIPPLNTQPAFAGVSVGSYDDHAASLGILLDHLMLVFGGILLVLGRHANVFSSSNRVRHRLR